MAVAGLLAESLKRLSTVETGFQKGELLVVELRHSLLVASQLYAVKPWDLSLDASACAAVSFLACAIPA